MRNRLRIGKSEIERVEMMRFVAMMVALTALLPVSVAKEIGRAHV